MTLPLFKYSIGGKICVIRDISGNTESYRLEKLMSYKL